MSRLRQDPLSNKNFLDFPYFFRFACRKQVVVSWEFIGGGKKECISIPPVLTKGRNQWVEKIVMIPFNHIAFIAFLFLSLSLCKISLERDWKNQRVRLDVRSAAARQPTPLTLHKRTNKKAKNKYHKSDRSICLPRKQTFCVHSSKSNNILFHCFRIVWNNLSILTREPREEMK